MPPRSGKLRLMISAASASDALACSMLVPVVPPRSLAERKSRASIVNCSNLFSVTSSTASPASRARAPRPAAFLSVSKSTGILPKHHYSPP